MLLPEQIRKPSCCVDKTENQWFYKREAAGKKNVFRGGGERNKFSWANVVSEHETWSEAPELGHRGRFGAGVYSQTGMPSVRQLVWTQAWLKEAGWDDENAVIKLIRSKRTPLCFNRSRGVSYNKNGSVFAKVTQSGLTDHSPSFVLGGESQLLCFRSGGTTTNIKLWRTVCSCGWRQKEQTGETWGYLTNQTCGWQLFLVKCQLLSRGACWWWLQSASLLPFFLRMQW